MIEVDICLGTTCFVMGASQLQELDKYLTPSQKKLVRVKGVTCLAACRSGNYISAPFVKVGETLLAEATLNSVLAEIERQLEASHANQQ